MRHLLGTCGTYIVTGGDGLAVLPEHPNASPRSTSAGDERPQRTESGKPSYSSSSSSSSECQPLNGPLRLSSGQTVQVSYIDEKGVAVLARGYGYIVADKEQLVKGEKLP